MRTVMRRRRRIGFGRGAAVLAAAMMVALAAPPQGEAAVGDLNFVTCFADTPGIPGCTTTGKTSQTGGVAVSPDGQSLYTASFGDHAINHFSLGASGVPSFASCVSNGGGAGCADPTPDALLGAKQVALTSDGTNVYVGSPNGSTISELDRVAGGGLSFDSCFEENDALVIGCDTPASSPMMGGTVGVAVRPSGSHVLVAAENSDTLVHFPRSAGGALNLPGCFRDIVAPPCTTPAQPALDGATGVAISPDGADAYVAARLDDAVSHFRFSTSPPPPLTFIGCIGNLGVDGCVNPPNDSLGEAMGITVSPDGRSVYVASNDGSITHLTRAANGSLTYQGCVANAGDAGCVDPPIDSLGGAQAVAVSPDGLSVYVASHIGHAVTELDRAADGSLTFSGCVAEAGENGCVDPPVDSLFGADGVAVSPNGASVYVGSEYDASLTHFAREVPPSGTAAAPSATPSATPPARPKPRCKKKKKRGKNRSALAKKKKKKCKRKKKRRK